MASLPPQSYQSPTSNSNHIRTTFATSSNPNSHQLFHKIREEHSQLQQSPAQYRPTTIAYNSNSSAPQFQQNLIPHSSLNPSQQSTEPSVPPKIRSPVNATATSRFAQGNSHNINDSLAPMTFQSRSTANLNRIQPSANKASEYLPTSQSESYQADRMSGQLLFPPFIASPTQQRSNQLLLTSQSNNTNYLSTNNGRRSTRQAESNNIALSHDISKSNAELFAYEVKKNNPISKTEHSPTQSTRKQRIFGGVSDRSIMSLRSSYHEQLGQMQGMSLNSSRNRMFNSSIAAGAAASTSSTALNQMNLKRSRIFTQPESQWIRSTSPAASLSGSLATSQIRLEPKSNIFGGIGLSQRAKYQMSVENRNISPVSVIHEEQYIASSQNAYLNNQIDFVREKAVPSTNKRGKKTPSIKEDYSTPLFEDNQRSYEPQKINKAIFNSSGENTDLQSQIERENDSLLYQSFMESPSRRKEFEQIEGATGKQLKEVNSGRRGDNLVGEKQERSEIDLLEKSQCNSSEMNENNNKKKGFGMNLCLKSTLISVFVGIILTKLLMFLLNISTPF